LIKGSVLLRAYVLTVMFIYFLISSRYLRAPFNWPIGVRIKCQSATVKRPPDEMPLARAMSKDKSCDVEVFRGYIGWNSILRVAFCPVAFCPVALCPGFWPIAVKLSSHHDLCRFSASVPAAACRAYDMYTFDTFHWWLTAMTMRNFRIRDRIVLHIRSMAKSNCCLYFREESIARFRMYLCCWKQVKKV